MSVRALLALALAGCGDNLEPARDIAATSGARLKLIQYRYEDGTLQPDVTAFYDIGLHAPCAPRRWADGGLRCVPAAEEARFTDAGCTAAIGMATEPATRPTHFLGFDTVDEERLPARIYRVNGATEPVSTFYLQRDRECLGPYAGFATDFYALGALEPTEVLAFTDRELGGARIGLQVREAPDGLRAPLGTYDRELEHPCAPSLDADGVVCEPLGAAVASAYLDSACSRPVVQLHELAEPPRIATVVDPRGCRRYHAVGAETELAPPLYRREGGLCVPAPVPLGRRVFAVEDELALAPLERTVEAIPARRLQRVTLSPVDDPDLRFVGEHLVDTATRAECVRASFGEVTRCMPANLAPAQTLYATGCTMPVAVTELPEETCSPVAFAARLSLDADAIDVFAIGEPLASPLYHYTDLGCVAYVPPAGRRLHELGPKLPPDTFPRAVKYGERAP